MIAIDTNVVVRALTGDDPAQARRAAAVLASGPIFVSKTVLVEVACVLRKAYEFPATRIGDALMRFVGLENLTVEDRAAVVTALEWHAAGVDFADALHVASSAASTAFATFDSPLAKRAARAGVRPRVQRI